ncbi:MAG: NlpC/P60 family protein [Oscillospiraceae bacterium]|nr:NlpC/P60 family protein [Oscillospiraceae bacterium]
MNRMLMTKALILVFAICLAVLCGCAGGEINVGDGEDWNPPPPDDSYTPGDIVQPLTPTLPGTEPPEIVDRPEPLEILISTPHVNITAEQNQIVQTAQSLLGTPFVDGASSPSEGFDNSGLIYYVLRQNGYVNCPRGITEQSVMGNRIDSIAELLPGDLVFFSENGERAQYGGVYTGDGIMVSCRKPGENVMEFDITLEYYNKTFFTGVRVV